MSDQSRLGPSRTESFLPTPSGLTPNTRTEAEAAFTANAEYQTESAAPTTPLVDGTSDGIQSPRTITSTKPPLPSPSTTRRPPIPTRSGSNYLDAAARYTEDTGESTAAFTGPGGDVDPVLVPGIAPGLSTALPTQSTTDLPSRSGGAVPSLPTGPDGAVSPPMSPVGASGGSLRRDSKPSLAQLGRQGSWNSQDLKRQLMGGMLRDEGQESNEGSLGKAGYESLGGGGVKE
ncbi:hypothetical protein M501DRAFT_1018124 [Patellaria atrata CBS 101060]|uniref:Uncharacterized protein n=1 Tax=Patellaria atrata CBS 101060 TaxID=1346257 RepID=A0A9P4S8W4_9PEZI|nr:hypothetical protein M501DRAFT_1018124 [Patellaria atrata CBS 101060]